MPFVGVKVCDDAQDQGVVGYSKTRTSRSPLDHFGIEPHDIDSVADKAKPLIRKPFDAQIIQDRVAVADGKVDTPMKDMSLDHREEPMLVVIRVL